MVTNAALRRAPSVDQRHQCDYTFCCPELPSVTSTAAANDNSVLRAVDATDCTNGCSEVLSVCHTAAGESQWLKCVGRFHRRRLTQVANCTRRAPLTHAAD